MIVTNPLILRTISEPVDVTTESLAIYFRELEGVLKNSKRPGIGLAGIQIGKAKRIAIIRIPEAKDCRETRLDLWNPEIVAARDLTFFSEGCLSVPNYSKSIQRYAEITLRNGDGGEYVLTGLEAICVQHEIDHMDGLTIRDKEYRVLQVGRNDPCPCGSGQKFKKCHIDKKDELALTHRV